MVMEYFLLVTFIAFARSGLQAVTTQEHMVNRDTMKHDDIVHDYNYQGFADINAHVVLYQKDEIDFLADWIHYHSSIFGHRNIHIIDNNSSNSEVLSVLNTAKISGAHIIRDVQSFLFKGKVSTRVIRSILDADPTVEFVFSLDADEFIVSVSPSNFSMLSVSRSAFQNILHGLPRDGHKYKMHWLQVLPCTSKDTTRPVVTEQFIQKPTGIISCTMKAFFFREGFIRTDDGNHAGAVSADTICHKREDLMQCQRFGCFHETSLGIVHYGRARSWESFKRKALRNFHATYETSQSSVPRDKCIRNHGPCLFAADIVDRGEGAVQEEYEKRCHREKISFPSIASQVLGF